MNRLNKIFLFPTFLRYGTWVSNPCNGGGWRIGIFYYNAYDQIELINQK